MAVTNDSREWNREMMNDASAQRRIDAMKQALYNPDSYAKSRVEQQARMLHAQAMRERAIDESPAYSMAEVEMLDGKTQTFMIKAAPRISQHLLNEMQDKGFLTMWNDTDVVCIRADQVKQFTLRAFTQEK